MVATVDTRTCYAAGVSERDLWEIVDRLEWTLRPYEAGESTPTPPADDDYASDVVAVAALLELAADVIRDVMFTCPVRLAGGKAKWPGGRPGKGSPTRQYFFRHRAPLGAAHVRPRRLASKPGARAEVLVEVQRKLMRRATQHRLRQRMKEARKRPHEAQHHDYEKARAPARRRPVPHFPKPHRLITVFGRVLPSGRAEFRRSCAP